MGNADSQAAAAKRPSTTVHLLAGGSAGLLSSFTLQPLDLLKTRLQQQQKENVGFRTTIAKEVRKLATVKELWRGALPSTLRTSVGAGLYFTILSQSRSYLEGLKNGPSSAGGALGGTTSVLPKLSHVENLATGFVVRAVVGFVTMPITIIKTRFESSMYNYNSMYEGFEGIYLDNAAQAGVGSLRNFFKGTVATLARDCPYAGLYVLFYEAFKNDVFPPVIQTLDYDRKLLSGVNNSAAAVCAASMATTITAPFDAIKTRLQLGSMQKGGAATLVAVTKQLVSEPGGASNLFSGLSLRLGRKALSAGISWCLYEELLKMF